MSDNKNSQGNEPVTDGWNAIKAAFTAVYPGQNDPRHYAAVIPWYLGGNDPLDGISIYDSGDCWHFVTFGLSELYEKETDDPEYSGYGMEFTLRLAKSCCEDTEREIQSVCGILQQIAKITFTSGELFRPYEYLYTGQKQGMDCRQLSQLTGFITVPDTKVAGITTPNGRVDFVEFIGATDAELIKLKDKKLTVEKLYEMLGSDITDYSRRSLI